MSLIWATPDAKPRRCGGMFARLVVERSRQLEALQRELAAVSAEMELTKAYGH